MELLQLRYFQTVARLEHMTKAAEELHIAQPALSKTISRLEQDVGVPLFDRHNRQIKLNDYGKIFLEQVEIALSAIERGKSQVREHSGLDTGLIVFATTNHQCDTELVSTFLSTYPNIKFRLTSVQSEVDKIRMLRSGEADYCITSTPESYSDLEEFLIFSQEIFLAVPPDHRFQNKTSISLSEAANESFIGLKEGTSFRNLSTAYCKTVGFEPAISLEVDNFEVMSSFVLRGMGVAFLPNSVKREDSPLRFIPIIPECLHSFRLWWHKDRYLSKAAYLFRDFLIQYYA